MTVSTTENKAFFTGNGVTTSFDFTFKYFNDSDIKVLLDGVLDETYTLTPNPSGDGGTITYSVAPTTETDGGLIYRELPFTQGTRIPTSDKIPRGTLENAFDRVTILTQQLQEQIGRSLVLPISFNNLDQLVLPEPQAGRALVWRDDLQGLGNTTVNLGTLLADCTAQAAAAAASAAAASGSASSASSSLSSANAAAVLAQTYRDDAYDWANAPLNTVVNDGTRTGRSAYHWSLQAQGVSVPMLAKGELFGFSGTLNTAVPAPTANGQVLVADDAQTSGLAWGYGMPTGIAIPFYGGEAYVPAGFVLAQGSIGSAASAATRRANADTLNLYTLLWNSVTNAIAPVSGGRGANAAADFAANKTITIPPPNGRAFIAKDNMGGTSANVVTSASFDGANAINLCGTGGEETHTQALSELRRHQHNLNGPLSSDGGTTRLSPPAVTTGLTDGGAGDPMNVMGPWMAVNIILKL